LQAGDSGSWVVDIEDPLHSVLGHVVASDSLGESYMIPIHETLQDIQQRLAVRAVRLPTEMEVLWSLQEFDFINELSQGEPARSMGSQPAENTKETRTWQEEFDEDFDSAWAEEEDKHWNPNYNPLSSLSEPLYIGTPSSPLLEQTDSGYTSKHTSPPMPRSKWDFTEDNCHDV
jgi:hypothetical protein